MAETQKAVRRPSLIDLHGTRVLWVLPVIWKSMTGNILFYISIRNAPLPHYPVREAVTKNSKGDYNRSKDPASHDCLI